MGHQEGKVVEQQKNFRNCSGIPVHVEAGKHLMLLVVSLPGLLSEIGLGSLHLKVFG